MPLTFVAPFQEGSPFQEVRRGFSVRPNLVRALSQNVALAAVFVALVLAFGERLAADSLELANGQIVTGVVRSIADGKLTIDIAKPAPVVEDKLFSAMLKGTDKKKGGRPAKRPQELRTYDLSDVVQVRFEATFDRSLGSPPLIDNDMAKSGRPVSGTIKLRAGYHRFALIYWHRTGGAFLRLAESRIENPNEDRQRFIRGDMLAHIEGGATETPSPGLDKEGYRLPETIKGKVSSKITYSLRHRADGRPFEKMGDLLTATVVAGDGMLDRISTGPFPDNSDNLAMLLSGYLHIKVDGVYKFVLSSDGGSQLYVGHLPAALRTIDASSPLTPWTVTLAEGETLRGTIESWTASNLGFSIAAGKSRVSLTIPIARVTGVWSNKEHEKSATGKEDKIDRSNLPAGQDVVFARSGAGAVQRVPGRVQGIQGDSLVLKFSGTNRKIALSKVVGVALTSDGPADPADQTFHEVVEIQGGIKIPGQLAALDERNAKFRTLWGQTLDLKTDDLTGVAVKNGKAISLTELKPADVKQIPFFDRVIPYRVNESLSGGPILLRDGKHSRGISVHAKTVLTYVLEGHFQRFRAKIGFQLPEGEMGDATIQVLGDEKPLFVKHSLRGDAPVEPIDLDLTGVNTLTLAVDFGRREDIGDRVVWADPTLIRAATGPLAKAP
jgi:NPCBM/NEW2 domain